MRKLATGLAGVAAVVLATACSDTLGVNNTTNPDVVRVFATPKTVEQFIKTGYQSAWSATSASTINPQTMVLSLESYATVANFGMASRATLPRVTIANDRGNQSFNENFSDFRTLQKLARQTANAIQALDKLSAGNPTVLGSVGQTQRARAWGFLTLGIAMGKVALVYDSAAGITHKTINDDTKIPPLMSYQVVMDSALAMIDSGIAVANAVPAGELSAFSATDWIRGQTVDRAQFVRIARSYKARYRAGLARTPQERADVSAGGIVDWAQVIADATNGIQSDLTITTMISAGWSPGWVRQAYVYQGWHMQPLLIIGMADTTGQYDTWLGTPVGQRQPFLIRTRDNRFPSGDTRAAQQTASGTAPAASGRPYFRNRPTGDDTFGDGWANSYYDNYRFAAIRASGDGIGSFVEVSKAEIDLLAAEGYYRQGNYAAALPLINTSRTAAGLPALVAADATTPVPGGQGCTPRVPQGPSYNTTACGAMLEALKWEKRMETSFTGYAQWWQDSRGWGDLPEGTATQWPVPYQEMDARLHPFYNLGGVGLPSGAAKGNYGY